MPMIEKQDQIALWKSHIQERTERGLTVVEWCEQQGISKGIYNYRRKVVHRAEEDAGLPPASSKRAWDLFQKLCS